MHHQVEEQRAIAVGHQRWGRCYEMRLSIMRSTELDWTRSLYRQTKPSLVCMPLEPMSL